MDQQEIRRRLAGALRQDVTEELWTYLVDREYIREVESGIETIDGLTKVVRELLRATRPRTRRVPGTAPLATAEQPDALWLERAKAVSDYHVKLAVQSPMVREFRAEVLRDQHLSDTQAYRMLRSPAASVFSMGELAAVGISPLELLSVEGELPPNSGRRRGHIADMVQIRLPTRLVELPVPASNGQGIVSTLEYPDERNVLRRISVRSGSLLDRLRNLSVSLANDHGWNTALACWFVLTGQPPLKAPIRAQLRLDESVPPSPFATPQVTVVLEIEAWMSGTDVAEAYRFYQAKVFPRRPRAVGKKALALFRFDLDQRFGAIKPPSWEQRRLAWNRLHGAEWPYEDRRLFRRDTERAWSDVLDHDYRLDDFSSGFNTTGRSIRHS